MTKWYALLHAYNSETRYGYGTAAQAEQWADQLNADRIAVGRVYDLTYYCTTPGPEPEEGTIRAYWTGEIDTWGKYTFRPVDGSPTLYLFLEEIVKAESLQPLEKRRRNACVPNLSI